MSDKQYYTSKPKIIHSRDSSNDSRTSYTSRSSTEGHYSSSRSSVAAGGFYSGEPAHRADTREHRHRTADDPRKYISTITSGKVDVTHHKRVIYDPDAPKSGDASSQHYQDSRKHKSH